MSIRAISDGTVVGWHVEAPVRRASTDTRVVAIVGSRQSGKTAPSRRIADDDGRTFVSLGNDQFRRLTRDHPVDFAGFAGQSR